MFYKTMDSKTHQEIGAEQELFYFDELIPGCCFYLPHGTRIFRKLQRYLQDQYRRRGFKEVMTPIIAKNRLWKKSGHWDKYQDDMYSLGKDEDDYSLCAMNCPKHCLLFKRRNRSYKELPLHLADFGMLHRNENSNSLRGLLRTRCFQQDDAHIFCRQTQIRQEISNSLDFLEEVYGKFGLQFELELSTKPEKYIGSDELWSMAEEQLQEALDAYTAANDKVWTLNESDGAFYGPKIDIHVKDSLGRSHQCATIQLDFNLPSQDRFGLTFQNEDGDDEEPVIIHRAIYGSFGRFLAIITEHYQGKWPFWLSPRQIKVLPINNECLEYSKSVVEQLYGAGYHVDLDISNERIPKMIAVAQVENIYKNI